MYKQQLLKSKLLCTKINMLHLTVYRKAYNWRHAVQQASVEVLEGQENTFSAWLSLSYMNEETRSLAIWQPAEVEELIEYWIKRRDFEERLNLVVRMGPETVEMQAYKREVGVELQGTVHPGDLETVRQTLIEFFTFLLLELKQSALTLHYTFQGVPQPTLKLVNKDSF
jgi:hypothetical protein